MPSYEDFLELAKSKVDTYNWKELVKLGILPDRGKFMPVITYPPITMYPRVDPKTIFEQHVNPPDIPDAVYVHIPFCASQCHYCHWIKKIAPNPDEVDDYLKTISMEMDLVSRWKEIKPIPVTSVLFGGGTPSYLSLGQLEKVLTDFVHYFDLAACRQFSFEVEPNSVLGNDGFKKLEMLKSFGVNRISMGVQSFEDNVLTRMGRIHSGAQAVKAIEQCKKAGMGSVSIDLIYGYQGQSLSDWHKTIATAGESGADAWHLYRLRIKRHGDMQGDIIDKFHNRPESFPSVNNIYLMKALGMVMSESLGYKQLFSRIFATSQKHVTQFMWDYCCLLTNVIGIGISSWSNHYRTFVQNVGGDFKLYRQMVHQGHLPIDRGLYRDRETEARRSFISPLKNDRVYKKRFHARTGLKVDEHFSAELHRLFNYGLLKNSESTVTLTPRGRFFADETVHQLFQKKYLYFMNLAHSLTRD